jgi:hypothetical protein
MPFAMSKPVILVKLTILAPRIVVPAGQAWKLPENVGDTTTKLKKTDFASVGIPQPMLLPPCPL